MAASYNFTGVYKGEIKLDQENTSLVLADMNQIARQARRTDDTPKDCAVDVPDYSSFVVVLLGKTGNGKSATGNFLLNRNVFLSQAGVSSVTTVSSHAETTWRGRPLVVVDTPGLGDPNCSAQSIRSKIEAGIRAVSPPPNVRFALLFVFGLHIRITEEDVDSILSLQAVFGNSMWTSAVAVWTHGAMLESKTLDEYFQGAPPRLLDLLGKMQGGSIVVEHKGTSKEQNAISREAVLEAAFGVSGPLPVPKPLGGKKARRVRQEAARQAALEEARLNPQEGWWCAVS